MLMYDLHCHIIPGADDGAQSIEETLHMLRIAASGMTRGIICTPHCNIEGVCENYWSAALDASVKKIRETAEKENLPVKLYAGQEVFLEGDFIKHIKAGKIITLNGSDYLLAEFPFDEKASSAYRKAALLRAEGYKPIIAHPERYGFIIEQVDAAATLKEIGCLLQINKGSLKGTFGERVAFTAHRIVSQRMADFVASDAHSPYKRTPHLLDVHEIISTLYSLEYADFLLNDNPLRVIRNQAVYNY